MEPEQTAGQADDIGLPDLNGDQSAKVSISSLTFSDGTIINLGPQDVLILVGPNNAGKSATLRAIWTKLSDLATSPVLTALTLTKSGSEAQFMKLLSASSFVAAPELDNPIFTFGGAGLYGSQAKAFWNSTEDRLGTLRNLFCKLLSADVRLDTSKPAPNIDIATEAPTHPVHSLISSAEIEGLVSAAFKQAFGQELLLNRLAGSVLPLSVGDRPAIPEGGDRLSPEYALALSALPRLADQGDGMRSFAGLLLHSLVGPETILLIDEPEAFLHPPQARQVGRLMSRSKGKQRQSIIATHSGDVLRGALDGGSSVTVVRIQRSENVNRVRQLDKTKIGELWSDPLLRYSNILDGLFHEKVIVCEGDADARFYSAISDVLIEQNADQLRPPDIMFTHCGGKHRVSVVVRALREVDVPVSVIVDFDVLNAEEPLRSIVIAAGGAWSTVENDWKIVNKAVSGKKPEFDAAGAIKGVQEVLLEVKDGAFPIAAAEKIQKILKGATPWATAKQTGKAFVPSGDPTQAYIRLIEKLRSISIFIVEVGELEGFVKSVPKHGPRWVNEALKKDLAGDAELEPARRFMGAILGI